MIYSNVVERLLKLACFCCFIYLFIYFQYRAIHGSTEFLSVEEDRGSNKERTM